jgi:hypothetical protein
MMLRRAGLRETKPAIDSSRAPAGAWIGNPFLWGVLVMMVVLGVTLYGVSKTVTGAVNTNASPPHTTGQGSPGSTGASSGIVR